MYIPCDILSPVRRYIRRGYWIAALSEEYSRNALDSSVCENAEYSLILLTNTWDDEMFSGYRDRFIENAMKAEDNLPEGVLAIGTKVGDLARAYFGDYVVVDFDYDKSVMVSQTQTYMDEGQTIIAEASFLVDGLFCAVDILKKTEHGYDIIEVKSSTHVTDIQVANFEVSRIWVGYAMKALT